MELGKLSLENLKKKKEDPEGVSASGIPGGIGICSQGKGGGMRGNGLEPWFMGFRE